MFPSLSRLHKYNMSLIYNQTLSNMISTGRSVLIGNISCFYKFYMTQKIVADFSCLGYKEHRQAKYTIAIVRIHFNTIRDIL